MAWVRFTADADWPRGKSWHVAYKAGMRCNVTAECAREVVAEGLAEDIRTPPRSLAVALIADPFYQAVEPK